MDEIQFNVGRLRVEHGTIDVFGWIFHPSLPIERLSIWVDGIIVAHEVAPLERPDVRDGYPDAAHSLRSGFAATSPFDGSAAGPHDVVFVLELSAPNGASLRRHVLSSRFDAETHDPMLPPPHLMERIGGAQDYLPMGVRILNSVLEQIESRRQLDTLGRILDWGCGSGRVVRHLMKVVEPSRIHGCDIDTEAIEWARSHLRGPAFASVPPHPPTLYPDSYFDAVYGVSVMTHLDEVAQVEWLEELRRVTRPGGVVLLTVLGAVMRSQLIPASLVEEFEQMGFVSLVPYYSDVLRPFSYEGYYRETFHGRSYLDRVWGRYFEIDAYVEERGGHDLVVLRRRADEAPADRSHA